MANKKDEPIVTDPAVIEAALADSVPAMDVEALGLGSDSIPDEGPISDPAPEPDPCAEIVLDHKGVCQIVAVERPRARLRFVDGLTWEHVGEDEQGRWVYRVH